MLLRPAEFTHASEKFEFTTKEFGARRAGRPLRRCRCPYHFVGWAAVANQLAAAWMWLAGAMPLSTVHSNSILYFSVILRNPWFSLGNNKCFWKENEKLYCENYWQCFRKNDGGGLFPLKGAHVKSDTHTTNTLAGKMHKELLTNRTQVPTYNTDATHPVKHLSVYV